MTELPEHPDGDSMYSDEKWVKSWFAILRRTMTGVDRIFLPRDCGFYRLTADVQPGVTVEIAADYMTKKAGRIRRRLYGTVTAATDGELRLRQVEESAATA